MLVTLLRALLIYTAANAAPLAVPHNQPLNVTWLLLNDWVPSKQQTISVSKRLLQDDGGQQRLALLDAIAVMTGEHGYDFRVNQQGLGVFNKMNGPRIPYVVHQMWKSAALETHSQDAVECAAILKSMSPDFLYILWTDWQIMDLIKSRYPGHFNYFLKLNLNIKRADVARYLILHRFGGLYVDLDVELRAPASQLLNPPTVTFMSYRSKEFELKSIEPFAGNALFACTPKSPIMRAVLHQVMTHSNQASTDVIGVLRHTGPLALGLVVSRFIIRAKDFHEVLQIFNSSSVGNVADGPLLAAHRQKHKWGKLGTAEAHLIDPKLRKVFGAVPLTNTKAAKGAIPPLRD